MKSDKYKYLAIISRGISRHEPIKKIHKRLFDMTINPNKVLLAYMIKLSNKAKKLDDGKHPTEAINGFFLLFNKFNNDCNKIINKAATKQESDDKKKVLQDEFVKNRKDAKIFYVASSHADSAEDHKDYQGKIYVDRYWKNYDKDGSLEKFIRKNDIRSVQWVTGSPVYFITRPNCRHYFVNYSIDDILNGKYHIPNRQIGDRSMSTPREQSIEHYQDMLKSLMFIYRQYPTDRIKLKIDKIKMILAKLKGEL